MFQLEVPFEGYSMSMFSKKVVKGGVRPKCDPKWPAEVSAMMTRGWGDPASRPHIDEVCEVLRAEISNNTDEEIDEIMDASRKSELSLHRGE